MSKAKQQLINLFQIERKAISACDIAQLERITKRKERLFQALEQVGAEQDFQQVRVHAQRNARLIEAMMQGIADAKRLLEAKGGDETYARNGGRVALTPPAGRLYRKA